MTDFIPYLSLGQGAYYLASGIWPLISMRTFEAVTGPKADDWLVKTVGMLIAIIGAVLLLAGFRTKFNLEIAVLGVASAAGLTFVDVWYVARKVISPIYLLDTIVEIALVTVWIIATAPISA